MFFRNFLSGQVVTGSHVHAGQFIQRRSPPARIFRAGLFQETFQKSRILHYNASGGHLRDFSTEPRQEFRIGEHLLQVAPIAHIVARELQRRARLDVARRTDVVRHPHHGRAERPALCVQ